MKPRFENYMFLILDSFEDGKKVGEILFAHVEELGSPNSASYTNYNGNSSSGTFFCTFGPYKKPC